MRAWHKMFLGQMPDPPEEQWSEDGVVRGTASWLAAAGGAGAEVDLAKAFDTVNHKAAAEALRYQGAPEEVVATLLAAWSAPRFCTVSGEIAEEILPNTGVPPGDPTSCRVLSNLLKPWHGVVKRQCPGVCTWAYVDDRSLKAEKSEEEAAEARVTHALVVTERCDVAMGVEENRKKRQRWTGDEQVEHLGITAAPASGLVDPPLPVPRGGWERISAVTKKLAVVPGSHRVREGVAMACISSKYRWAAPYISVPPDQLVGETFTALARARAKWWCTRRYWADNLSCHPQFGTMVQVCRAAGRINPQHMSAMLRKAVSSHVQLLGLEVVSHDAGDASVWVWPKHQARCDPRSMEEFLKNSRLFQGGRRAFCVTTERGPHLLRMASRVALLAPRLRGRKRFDEEGIQDVDVNASSDPKWLKWRRQLNDHQRQLLHIWRAGAVWTPTRRWRGEEECRCPWCGHPHASARHFWAECEKFNGARVDLDRRFQLEPGWWQLQPRVTSKTGWITKTASTDFQTRVRMQMAACQLGVAIMNAIAMEMKA